MTINTDGLTLRAQGGVSHADLRTIATAMASAICPATTSGSASCRLISTPVPEATRAGVGATSPSPVSASSALPGKAFGFGTENLKVSHVVAIDNTAYGVASFDGIGQTFIDKNAVQGGPATPASASTQRLSSASSAQTAPGKMRWASSFVTARRSFVSDNEAWGNCLGVFLLADGQAGGSGDTFVLNNTVTANNSVCTQFAAGGFLPVLGGGGIVLAGSQQNAVLHNVVRDNRGDTLFSGGIVLVATPRANADGSFDASTNNLVVLNTARGNEPADIVQDEANTPNFFAGNRCRTSTPDGRCD